MTHACNPSYLGGWDPEDHSAGHPKQKVKLYLKNNQSKKG
jgi:hypothetical protein